MNKSIREISLNIITDVLNNDALSHLALRNALDLNDSLSKQERSFINRLCNGTIEKMIYLDYVINQFSKTKVNKMKPLIQNVLRMALYEILFMDASKEYASVNEAVVLVKNSKYKSLSGFVNGILRNIIRNKDNIKLPDKDKQKIEYLSCIYSMPEWIIRKWIKDYDEDVALKLLEGSTASSNEISVRINIFKATKAEVKKELEEQGVAVKDNAYYENALLLDNVEKIASLSAFKNGHIQPQDVSSMLVGCVANPKPGDLVIDVCAAPGGKSLHAADLGATVKSFDLTENKVNLIKENIKRTGFANITADVKDATIFDEELFEKADIVIADLPCSGLGIISKKADIKYKTKSEDIKALTEIQRRILDNVSKYVKPGGVLIFSTCTVNRNENDKNVKYIEELGFKKDSLDDFIVDELKNETTKEGYLQLFQGIHACHGFFISRFIKQDS